MEVIHCPICRKEVQLLTGIQGLTTDFNKNAFIDALNAVAQELVENK